MAKDLITGKEIKEIKPIKEKAKKKSPLFDHLNLMFKKPKEFADLSNYEKNKHMFMMNRFFSMKYPAQAQYLNKLNINGAQVVQYWANTLSNLYTSVPGWIWQGLKGVKTKKASKKKLLSVKDSTITYYCQKMNLSKREVEYAIKTIGDEFKQELLSIEKMIEN